MVFGEGIYRKNKSREVTELMMFNFNGFGREVSPTVDCEFYNKFHKLKYIFRTVHHHHHTSHPWWKYSRSLELISLF